MIMRLPGTVLIMDDRLEDLEDLRKSLISSGHGIITIDGLDIPEVFKPRNVRLAIIDLDLDRCGDLSSIDKSAICRVLYEVESRSQFFLCYIWSHLIKDEAAEKKYHKEITEFYCKTYKKDILPGILVSFRSRIPSDYREIVQDITGFMSENPAVGLAYEWECMLDEARDRVTDVLFRAKENGLHLLAKALSDDFVDSLDAARECMSVFNRIFLTKIHEIFLQDAPRAQGYISVLAESLQTVLATAAAELTLIQQFGELYCSQAYTTTVSNQRWTGDILKTKKRRASHRFAVVITPACDMVRSVPNSVSVVYGGQITRNQKETTKLVEDIKCKLPKKNTPKKLLKYIVGQTPKAYLHPLFFIPDNESFKHILLDFSTVEAVTIAQLEKWKPICKLGPEVTDKLLTRYSAFSGRVGILEIPKDLKTILSKRWYTQ